MYYFMMEATPQPDSKRAIETGGAYVNCWIDFPLADGAELLARHYLKEAGWDTGEVQERNWVERQQYEEDPEALAYFVEAEQDGVSLVFYQWPVDAEDTDIEYQAASGAA